MSRERVLQRRLHTLATLKEAVSALRSLSAQHFRAACNLCGSSRALRARRAGRRRVHVAGAVLARCGRPKSTIGSGPRGPGFDSRLRYPLFFG